MMGSQGRIGWQMGCADPEGSRNNKGAGLEMPWNMAADVASPNFLLQKALMQQQNHHMQQNNLQQDQLFNPSSRPGIPSYMPAGPLQFSFDHRAPKPWPNPASNFYGADDSAFSCRMPRILGASNSAGGKELFNFSKMATSQEMLEAKALAASKSHSEAERRRRERINSHLATLRTLLPSSTKTDKASLLAEVIDYVKELKRQAAEIAEGGPVPTDVDELNVDTDCTEEEDKVLIRASLCCEDRPDLLSDLIRTLRSLKLQTVRAEMATHGGRIKNVFVIKRAAEEPEPPSLACVQEALRSVMERPNSTDHSPTSSAATKRPKLASFNFSVSP